MCGPTSRSGARSLLGSFGKALQRRLQVAFRVDQEVGRDDDWLAAGYALPNLHITRASVAQLDFARLEAALALVDEHGLAAAGVHDSAVGNRQDRLATPGVDLRVDIHVVKQDEVRIRQFDANTRRPRLLVDLRINHLDLPRELAPRKAPGLHGGRLTDGDRAQIAFRDID